VCITILFYVVSFEKEKVSELIEQVRAFNEEVSLIINKESDANN
jgi:hypothetical protein